LPKVDLVTVWSVPLLGMSAQTPLDTLAELHRHRPLVVIHDHADDAATIETGGLLVAADLLVDARRRYWVEASALATFGRRASSAPGHVQLSTPPLPLDRARY
jgi:hypothetical protein